MYNSFLLRRHAMKITWENVGATKRLKVILAQFIFTNRADSFSIEVQ